MKPLPIPEPEQIVAMLNGTVFDLLANYVEDPRSVSNFRHYLSISRRELIEYLAAHPDEVRAYCHYHSLDQNTHDVERIYESGSGFVVVSMYRGEQRSPRRFATLAEAVAEKMLLDHMMY